MTIEQLLTKLKRIEIAARKANPHAGAVTFQMSSDGLGCLVVEDQHDGPNKLHFEFDFNSPMEFEVGLGGIIAGIEEAE